MRKIGFLLFALIFAGSALAQTTATNFNVNDCTGTSHNLFSDLDAGKVIVLVWVMPCGACVGPSLAANSVIQKFAASFPGRISLYLVDDLANTNCTTLSLWAKSNEIPITAAFSDATIKMTDYGTVGMPKIVALAGTGHEIIFNQNSGVDVTLLTGAISKRLISGISEIPATGFNMSLYPNPLTSNTLKLKYISDSSEDVNIDIFNALGSNVKKMALSKVSNGNNEIEIDLGFLSSGVYFFRLTGGRKSGILKLIVNH